MPHRAWNAFPRPVSGRAGSAVRVRPGMSLIELLIALLLLAIITTAALRALETQLRAFTVGNERMDLLQTFRFAANLLEKDIRTAGMGVPGPQPFLIYAGADVIAFNANYATNDPNDPFAVYRRLSAPDSEVMALRRDQRIEIPTTGVRYPDTTYYDGPVNSPAETIIFFFVEDSSATAPGTYALMRQVNAQAPEIVSRNLKRSDEGEPFFEYLRLEGVESGSPNLTAVPAENLPLHHAAPIHGSAADTGHFALVDDVRAVRVRFTATNGRTGEEERTGQVSRLIRMPNAGLAVYQTCGDTPILGTSLIAEDISSPTGQPRVRLRWSPAVDESGGERDVVRYVLWRRPLGALDWNEPLVSIPAGMPTYEFVDTRAERGASYVYAVAAQDCTPSLSELAVSTLVTIDP